VDVVFATPVTTSFDGQADRDFTAAEVLSA
jgi:hypothetical protein